MRFGTYDVGEFYVNGLVGGAYHGYTVNRYINFGGLNRTATGRLTCCHIAFKDLNCPHEHHA